MALCRLRLLAARSRSHRQGGRHRRDRIAEALVRRARSRSALQELGRVPLSRESRLRPSRAGAAARSGDARRRCSVPTSRLRRREGFKLTDPRFSRREVLSEIHYCVLCHERDKDTCSKGIRDKEGKVTDQPARHSAGRLPARREDLRDAHAAQARRRDRRRSRSSPSTTRCARAPAIASATTA